VSGLIEVVCTLSIHTHFIIISIIYTDHSDRSPSFRHKIHFIRLLSKSGEDSNSETLESNPMLTTATSSHAKECNRTREEGNSQKKKKSKYIGPQNSRPHLCVKRITLLDSQKVSVQKLYKFAKITALLEIIIYNRRGNTLNNQAGTK